MLKGAGGRFQHDTHAPYVCCFEYNCKVVHGCYSAHRSERVPRRQQFQATLLLNGAVSTPLQWYSQSCYVRKSDRVAYNWSAVGLLGSREWHYIKTADQPIDQLINSSQFWTTLFHLRNSRRIFLSGKLLRVLFPQLETTNSFGGTLCLLVSTWRQTGISRNWRVVRVRTCAINKRNTHRPQMVDTGTRPLSRSKNKSSKVSIL